MAGSVNKTETPFWIKFFKDAGIPPGDATSYAITFTDHRIKKTMLSDLNKDYLTDMGIDALGDIIAILKHAKTVHAQDVREKALMGLSPQTGTPPQGRRSTPASRTISHYIGSEGASPMNSPLPVTNNVVSDQLAARLGPIKKTVRTTSSLTEVVPVPKKRRVFKEHEGKYKITMPQGSTPKTQKILQQKGVLKRSSVFDRLGEGDNSVQTSPTITVTGLSKLKMDTGLQPSGVFGRLGGKKAVKRAATSTSPDSDEDESEPVSPLEYQGLFKSGVQKPKKKKVEVLPQATSTLISDSFKTVSVKKRLGGARATPKTTIPATKPKGVMQRLGPKSTSASEPVSSTTTTIKNITKKKKQPAAPQRGVFSRLGKVV